MDRLLRPHGVFIAYYGDKPIPETVSEAVMGFFYLYMASVAALAALLAWTGVDFVTAVSGAATAICNVGPGLGPNIGPHGTFADLPDAAKWLLAGGMLLGRLEIFTVLVILTPAFGANKGARKGCARGTDMPASGERARTWRESVDATDLKSVFRMEVGVRVPRPHHAFII